MHMRAIIYARVSTRDQELDNQIAQLREYAIKQGWDVVDVIVDVGSGGKGVEGRPGLDKAFHRAHRREYDLLLFWALDRLSREGSRKTIEYLTLLDRYGIAWHSFTEQYLSSLGVFSDCIIALLSALAKQEKLRIGERTRAGIARARASGKRLGRPRTPADLVAQARELRRHGLSYAAIGKALRISRSRAFQLVK